MSLQVHCKRCGKAFTPARRDIVRGDWRICPGCRGKAPADDPGRQGEITQEAITDAPDGLTETPERPAAAAMARQSRRRRWWWRWLRRWRWHAGGEPA